MGPWVWLLIGFVAGLVVVAIFSLIFRKDPTAELEQAADDRGAQLSKAEMKTAVLQEKLLESETAREEQNEASEAACQAQLAQVEANYQRKLDTLEKQFADLEASFAAQLAAKEEEKLAAAGVAASLVAASAIAHDEPEVVEPMAEFEAAAADEELDAYVSELEEIETIVAADQAAAQIEQEEGAADGLDLADAALMATGAATVAALAVDDSDESEPGAGEAVDDEVEQDFESAADEPAEDEAVAGMVAEMEDDAQMAVDEPADDEAGAGLAAKAAVAVGGAAIAAAVLSDEPDDEEEGTEFAAETDDAQETLIEDADDSLSETADLDQEAEVFSEEAVEVEGEADEDEGHAAAVAAALAGGTAAAALAAAGDDEAGATEESLEQIDEIEEAQEETAVPDSENGPDEEPFDEPGTDQDDLTGAGAAVLGAAAVAELVDEETAGEEVEIEEEIEEEEPAPPPWPEDTSTWQGEYFNNMKLEGDPVLVREDAEVDFDWGMDSPAPEVNVDGFSARWTRTADLPPGLYRFTVTSDDGARLWVNDRMVISAWYDHTEMTFRREMELPGGPVELRLEYYENAMAALIRVSWERIG